RAAILVRRQLTRARDGERERGPHPESAARRGERRRRRIRRLRRPPGRARQAGEPDQHEHDGASAQNTTRNEKNVGFCATRSEPVRKVRARSTPIAPLETPIPTLGPLSPSCTKAYPPRSRTRRWRPPRRRTGIGSPRNRPRGPPPPPA